MLKIPKEIEKNIDYRIKLLDSCDNDSKLKVYIKEICKNDTVLACNLFCWTYDPRLDIPVIPFILYPKQEKLIRVLDDCLSRSKNGENISLLLDKPRDVGATFTLMTWGLLKWLFDDFSFRVGSRKEDYVDKRGDTDTLFHKIDFNLDRMPKWLLPTDFCKEKHRASMILKNPENNNVISGESANPNFARGGRKTAILFDELGFWDWARSSWETAGESTNFRICMSTPPSSGRDSFFYKLRRGTEGKIKLFNFEWTDVPSRDNEWLRIKKASKSEEEFAREVLKSYDGTVTGKVYARDMRLVVLSDVDYDPELPLFIAWDFGLDEVAMIWIQKDFKNNKLYIIDSYSNSDKSIDYYIPFVNGIVESGVHEYTRLDLEKIELHRNWNYTITHFGDPDVKKRDLKTGKSTRDYLRERGIYIQSKDWGGRTWKDLRENTKMTFRRLEINEIRNEYLISALRNASYPERRENSQSTTIPLKPIHNWTSHMRSSYEYFCDNEPQSYQSEKEKELIKSESLSKFDKYAQIGLL